MRLIDADAYLKKVCTYNETGCGSCKLQTRCPVDAPTVDAVPVEWIEQYKQSIGSQTLVGYHWIEKMQKAWAERREE